MQHSTTRMGKHVSAVALAVCCACAAASQPAPDWASVVRQTSVTLPQAVAQATAATGGQAIEADLKHGKWGQSPGYAVELITAASLKTQVWIDATTGQVGSQRSKPAKAKYTQRLNAAQVSMEQAIAAATQQVGGQALSTELDTHWGAVVFGVKVLRDDGVVQKLLINAQNASVQPLVPPLAVSLQQAIALALQAAPGQAIEAELEDDKYGPTPVYAVEIITHAGMKTELWVDADTGQVSVHKSKPAKDKYRNRLNAATLSLEQAIAAALSHTDGQVLGAELDSAWGRSSYAIKILREDGVVQKLVIDAGDGALLHQRWE